MKKTILLATVAGFALTAPAFADESYKSDTKIEKTDSGDYKEKDSTSKTDAAGTTTSVDKKVKVDAHKDGSTDKSVETKEVTDPKGLMNKETTKTKDTEKTNADGTVKTTHKKTVDGKTVEDTTTKQ